MFKLIFTFPPKILEDTTGKVENSPPSHPIVIDSKIKYPTKFPSYIYAKPTDMPIYIVMFKKNNRLNPILSEVAAQAYLQHPFTADEIDPTIVNDVSSICNSYP